jgi:hypothetical protein
MIFLGRIDEDVEKIRSRPFMTPLLSFMVQRVRPPIIEESRIMSTPKLAPPIPAGTVYKVTSRLVWVGTVEAADETRRWRRRRLSSRSRRRN